MTNEQTKVAKEVADLSATGKIHFGYWEVTLMYECGRLHLDVSNRLAGQMQ